MRSVGSGFPTVRTHRLVANRGRITPAFLGPVTLGAAAIRADTRRRTIRRFPADAGFRHRPIGVTADVTTIGAGSLALGSTVTQAVLSPVAERFTAPIRTLSLTFRSGDAVASSRTVPLRATAIGAIRREIAVRFLQALAGSRSIGRGYTAVGAIVVPGLFVLRTLADRHRIADAGVRTVPGRKTAIRAQGRAVARRSFPTHAVSSTVACFVVALRFPAELAEVVAVLYSERPGANGFRITVAFIRTVFSRYTPIGTFIIAVGFFNTVADPVHEGPAEIFTLDRAVFRYTARAGLGTVGIRGTAVWAETFTGWLLITSTILSSVSIRLTAVRTVLRTRLFFLRAFADRGFVALTVSAVVRHSAVCTFAVALAEFINAAEEPGSVSVLFVRPAERTLQTDILTGTYDFVRLRGVRSRILPLHFTEKVVTVLTEMGFAVEGLTVFVRLFAGVRALLKFIRGFRIARTRLSPVRHRNPVPVTGILANVRIAVAGMGGLVPDSAEFASTRADRGLDVAAEHTVLMALPSARALHAFDLVAFRCLTAGGSHTLADTLLLAPQFPREVAVVPVDRAEHIVAARVPIHVTVVGAARRATVGGTGFHPRGF